MERDHRYDDIIGLDRPPSPGHPPMTMLERAAQFSPFAALTGYEDAIAEAARITDRRLELGEEAQQALDQQLQRLQALAASRPLARVTRFLPDEKKEGGAYVTAMVRVRGVDPVARVLRLAGDDDVPFDDLLAIQPAEEA